MALVHEIGRGQNSGLLSCWTRNRARRFKMRWLLGKTIVMLEGLGLRLNPDFDVFAVAEPYGNRLMKQQVLPETGLGRSILTESVNWRDLMHRLPCLGQRMLERMDRNEPFPMEIKDTNRMLSRLD